MFVTLPVAFARMPHGQLFGSLMFLLLSFAGLTATIVILEALVAYLIEVAHLSRKLAASAAGVAIWLAGVPTVLSFGAWRTTHPLSWIGIASDKTPFAIIDYLASNILLPVGGLMVALLAGWALSREVVCRELGLGDGPAFRIWYAAVRYLVPLAIGIVLVAIQR